jgi:four helix bundle protein
MTKKPYDLRDRSFLYACDIVKFTRQVADYDHVLRHLAWQLVDAGGSVGANLAEGVAGQSKPDFTTKHFTALKEAWEARFWLRVIAACEPRFKPSALPLVQESEELIAILTTSVKTAQSSTRRGEPQCPE